MIVDQIPRHPTAGRHLSVGERAAFGRRAGGRTAAPVQKQLRQFKIGEAAWSRIDQASQGAADAAQGKLDVLELELERYAQRARDTGRICALDDADLQLFGVRKAAEPDRPGGR